MASYSSRSAQVKQAKSSRKAGTAAVPLRKAWSSRPLASRIREWAKSTATAAAAMNDGSPRMRPALASAAAIRPFQSARILSSSSGRTRRSRASRSLRRA